MLESLAFATQIVCRLTIQSEETSMKRLYCRLVLFALAFAALFPANDAQADAGIKVDSDVNVAAAYFVQVDGCIETRSNVAAWDNLNRVDHTTTTQLLANVDIARFDICDPAGPVFVSSASAYGSVSAHDLNINNSLKSATLKTTMLACDYVSNTGCFDLAVDITWTGTGALIPGETHHSIFEEDGCRFYTLDNHNMASRTSNAVGTITTATTTFISGTAQDSYLTSLTGGYMIKGCGSV